MVEESLEMIERYAVVVSAKQMAVKSPQVTEPRMQLSSGG